MSESDASGSEGAHSSRRKRKSTKWARLGVEHENGEDEEEEEEDESELMELLDDEEPEEGSIELNGEVWLNLGARNREIIIKGKWKLSNVEEEQDFEYSYFKEFDKTLGLAAVESPVFAIEKDYAMLLKGGLKTPAFSREQFTIKNIPKLFGGVYRGWFEYNGQTLDEFSSLNFLPAEGGEENKFSIEGDGHNSIGVYIIDGAATINVEPSHDDGGEMTKVGDIKFSKYYSSLKTMNDPMIRKKNEESGEDAADYRISIKINKQVFGVQAYTPEEARELRKTLPQFT